MAIFSGELAPDMKCFKLRIPVPAELIGGQIVAEVERAPDTYQDRRFNP
jgi:hypothetical protein